MIMVMDTSKAPSFIKGNVIVPIARKHMEQTNIIKMDETRYALTKTVLVQKLQVKYGLMVYAMEQIASPMDKTLVKLIST